MDEERELEVETMFRKKFNNIDKLHFYIKYFNHHFLFISDHIILDYILLILNFMLLILLLHLHKSMLCILYIVWFFLLFIIVSIFLSIR